LSVAHLADVVGVALGLEELGGVMRQRVLLMDLFQTSLVEQLGGRTSRGQQVLSEESRPLIGPERDSHRSSEAG